MHCFSGQENHSRRLGVHVALLYNVVLFSGHKWNSLCQRGSGHLWLPCFQEPLHADLFPGLHSLLCHPSNRGYRTVRTYIKDFVYEPSALTSKRQRRRRRVRSPGSGQQHQPSQQKCGLCKKTGTKGSCTHLVSRAVVVSKWQHFAS